MTCLLINDISPHSGVTASILGAIVLLRTLSSKALIPYSSQSQRFSHMESWTTDGNLLFHFIFTCIWCTCSTDLPINSLITGTVSTVDIEMLIMLPTKEIISSLAYLFFVNDALISPDCNGDVIVRFFQWLPSILM